MAEVMKLCHICGKPAKSACKMCGRPSCSDHYDAKTGMCSECAGGKKFGRTVPQFKMK